ncbi:hypothetical protein FALCPG4_010226 [Fusarium falciforme]
MMRPLLRIGTYTACTRLSWASRNTRSFVTTSRLSLQSPAMKLLYPTSLKLDVSSIEGFSVELKPYDVKKTIPEDLIDAEVLVTWTNSAENLKDAAARMKNLRWIQSLAAGPNDVLSAGFDTSKITVTTGSGLHDRTVAEHALGLLLNAARRFYEMRDYQLQGKWPGHLGGPQPDRPAGAFTTLRDARVLIWGFGNIAKTLTPHLLGLGAEVRGIARRRGVRDGIEVYGEDSLAELLPRDGRPGHDPPPGPTPPATRSTPSASSFCPSTRGSSTSDEALQLMRMPWWMLLRRERLEELLLMFLRRSLSPSRADFGRRLTSSCRRTLPVDDHKAPRA